MTELKVNSYMKNWYPWVGEMKYESQICPKMLGHLTRPWALLASTQVSKIRISQNAVISWEVVKFQMRLEIKLYLVVWMENLRSLSTFSPFKQISISKFCLIFSGDCWNFCSAHSPSRAYWLLGFWRVLQEQGSVNAGFGRYSYVACFFKVYFLNVQVQFPVTPLRLSLFEL
jgi:hypothetical protein